MKHTFEFNPVNCDIRSVTLKLDDALEDMRSCDVTFASDNFKMKMYMMEPDIRAFAEWVLENTK